MQKGSVASKIAAHPKILLVFAIILIFFTWPRKESTATGKGKEGCPKIGKRFGIMMDAGSTGSRTHVFEFMYHADGRKELIREVFEQLKPGLSAYPNDPTAAADSLKPLMEIAVKEIPKEYQACTPVAIKATAGLRLIGKAKSEAILKAVAESFRTYPFSVAPDAAVVMDGKDEGPYAWLTINFLLGVLDGKSQTNAIFDLGGGSTQVVFIPDDLSTFDKAPKENVLEVNFAGNSYKLYTQSYLGLGLKEAAKAIRQKDDDKVCENTQDKSTQNYKKCHSLVESAILRTGAASCEFDHCGMRGAYQPPLLPSFKGDLYIFSYFYDRLEEWLPTTGITTVGKFAEVGEGLCSNDDKYSEHNKGSMCMDLSFEHALLSSGYNLPEDRSVLVKKKINDVETAWPLGAMLLAM